MIMSNKFGCSPDVAFIRTYCVQLMSRYNRDHGLTNLRMKHLWVWNHSSIFHKSIVLTKNLRFTWCIPCVDYDPVKTNFVSWKPTCLKRLKLCSLAHFTILSMALNSDRFWFM
jgi:hypothetical protein